MVFSEKRGTKHSFVLSLIIILIVTIILSTAVLSVSRGSRINIKLDADDPFLLEEDLGPEVDLFADLDPKRQTKQAQTILARQLEGYAATTELFGDALDRRASQLLLNFNENMGIRYFIDGV